MSVVSLFTSSFNVFLSVDVRPVILVNDVCMAAMSAVIVSIVTGEATGESTVAVLAETELLEVLLAAVDAVAVLAESELLEVLLSARPSRANP